MAQSGHWRYENGGGTLQPGGKFTMHTDARLLARECHCSIVTRRLQSLTYLFSVRTMDRFSWLYPLFLAGHELAFSYLTGFRRDNDGFSIRQLLLALLQICYTFYCIFEPLSVSFRELIFRDGSFDEYQNQNSHMTNADHERGLIDACTSILAIIGFLVAKHPPIKHLFRWIIGFHRFYAISVLANFLLNYNQAFLMISNFFLLSWLTTVILGIDDFKGSIGWIDGFNDDQKDNRFQHYLVQGQCINDLVIHVDLEEKKLYLHPISAGCWNVELVPKKLCDLPIWILEEVQDNLAKGRYSVDERKRFFLYCRFFPENEYCA